MWIQLSLNDLCTKEQSSLVFIVLGSLNDVIACYDIIGYDGVSCHEYILMMYSWKIGHPVTE